MDAEGCHADGGARGYCVLFVLKGFVWCDAAYSCRYTERETVAFGNHGAEVRELLEFCPGCGFGDCTKLGAKFRHNLRVG